MGNTILWVVFGIMLVFSAIFVVTSQRVAYRYRLLHVTTLLVNVIAVSPPIPIMCGRKRLRRGSVS